MADKDAKYFNCSEAHELDQVSAKYRDREKVKAFIREKCNDKTIHYWTHEKLTAYLAENGFQLIKTVGLTELATSLADQLGGKAQAQAACKAVIDGITAVLKAGDAINFKGFGTFKVEERAARQGTNPRTGEKMEIAASKAIKFTPSKVLKDEVNGTAK